MEKKNIEYLKIVKNILLKFYRAIKVFVFAIGIFSVIMIVLAFTDLPYYSMRWLATSVSGKICYPQYIVVLGGGGMPGESNLMRLYFASVAAKKYPDAKIIISLPGDTTDSTSSVSLMKKEMIASGCARNRILLENKGENTRAEALRVASMIGKNNLKQEVLLITSPEHMRRAVKTFFTAGMINVRGLPAFEQPLEADFSFIDKSLGGNSGIIPDIGDRKTIRYQFWNHLKYEISVFRELIALWYYSLKGWVL